MAADGLYLVSEYDEARDPDADLAASHCDGLATATCVSDGSGTD